MEKGMTFGKCIVWAIFYLALSIGPKAWAQAARPPIKKTADPVAATASILPDTVKVPKFSVRFGPYNGTIPTLTDDIKKLVGTELIVTDQQGQRWNTVAFRFGWNKREESVDIKTGRKKTVSNFDATDVDSSSRIPEAWQNALKENIRSGEDLIFERIIIEHPGSKRKMVAPDLRLTIR